MLCKWMLFDVKHSLCSGVTLLLLGVFFFLTLSGIYFGTLQLQEINILERGNDKVVKVSNTGSFTEKMEKIVNRNLRNAGNKTDQQARFLASRLVQFWLYGGVMLILIYGDFFIRREREGSVFRTLLTCPVSFEDYYWVKAFSGLCYWGIFLFLYGFVLGGAAVLCFGATVDFLVTLAAGLVSLWVYLWILLLLYLLVSLGLTQTRNMGAMFLSLVLIFAFFIPAILQIWVTAQSPNPPEIPHTPQSTAILAYIPERQRTADENRLIEADLAKLTLYQAEMQNYLVKGIRLEEQVAYVSPILVAGRVLKSFFCPEMIYCEEFLKGELGNVAIDKIIQRLSGSFIYFSILIGTIIFLTVVLLKWVKPLQS